MALTIKMQTQVEIKITAEKFYNFLRLHANLLSNICSALGDSKVVQGNWNTDGSIIQWSYMLGGKLENMKVRVGFEDGNKKVTYDGVEGDALQRYDIFKWSWQAVPKAGGRGIVTVVIEFKKMDKGIKSPDDYLDMLAEFITEIDAHFPSA